LVEDLEGLLPLRRIDANKVVLLAPLPIKVSNKITRGLASVRSRAASKALSTAGRSLPSTRCTCQPNAAHLSASGSKPSTLPDGPSACWLLMSTRQIRLPKPWCAAPIAASHTEPSSSSPSDIEL
jgi:hypothetical protein